MRTAASVRWFPLHALLLWLPLGALPLALAFDALYASTLDPAWFRAAFVATLAGAAGLYAAAFPGVIDYFANVPREGEVWKHANVHALLGLALVGYFTLSAAARWANLTDPGAAAAWGALALSALGNAGLLVQSVIGRGLVLRHYVTVEEQHVSPQAAGAEPREREP